MRPWVVLLAACGGTAQPVVIANKPAIDPVSCMDAAKILRGIVTSDDAAAGPARESAILRSCQGDAWSRAVLDCIGTARPPASCIAKLEDKQRDSYEAKLDTWDAQYAVAADPVDDTPVRYVACESLHVPPEAFSPRLDGHSPERDWQLHVRTGLVAEACDKEWSEPTRECLADDDLPTCEAMALDIGPLTARLAELDATAQKIATARQQPKSITCAKAVEAHYAPATWKAKLAKDRAHEIARSKKEMLAACTTESWSVEQRACIVVGGDTATCYANDLALLRFGYPALSLVPARSAWPIECQIYGAVMDRFATSCTSIDQPTRDALRASFDQATKMWTQGTIDPAAVAGCRLGAKAMVDVANACGT